MAGMAKWLCQQGIDAHVVSPQPGDGTVGLEVLAWQLAKQIETSVPSQQSIGLVGFSMGGLIARCYVQQMGGFLRTQQLITLSTPHHGTKTAHIYERTATRQMRAGSSFLHELNRDLSSLEQLNFTSIWTPFDLTIVPAESSRLPVGEMLQIPTLIHRFVVDDRRVWRAVAERMMRDA